MQGDRTLITSGGIGAAIAAICCATPLLAIVLGAMGLTAWLAAADYAAIAALLISLTLLGVGLYRRRAAGQACCNPSALSRGANHE